MMNLIITIVAMACCSVALCRSVYSKSTKFDKIFYAVSSAAFLIIGIYFCNIWK
nr:MAG TPA: hypothetical protein [Caudoviricetes sp.]